MLIVAAAVIIMLGVVILPTMIETVTGSVNATQTSGTSSACKTQIQQAERSNSPSIVTDRCTSYTEQYAENPSFAEDVEYSLVPDLIA
jgi:type II secretory pathway pseudopilin PulG